MKIALSGKAQSGKDTLAKMLMEEKSFHAFAFADKLKEIALSIYPQMDRDALFGESDLRETFPPGLSSSYREIIIELSRTIKRYDDDIWLKHLDIAIETHVDIIVKDLRYKKEFTFLKEKGFFIVRIKRNTNKIILDKSETEQDELPDEMFDFVIENNKDTTYLCDQSKLILREYEIRQTLFSTASEASRRTKIL